MSKQTADFRSVRSTLRRRRGLIVFATLVGLAGGAGYVITEPPPLTSTTLVLLPTPALAESSNSDVVTQVRIARSANILQQAGTVVEPNRSLRQVERMVEVSAPTNQLIQIEATSTNADEARILSQAVADGYVNYVRDTAREVTAAALAALTTRRDALKTQINQLQKEIAATVKRQKATAPNSADARKEAQLLAGLRTEQANLALQLDKVQDKIATGTPVGSSATGTLVVQPATAAAGLAMWMRLLIWVPLAALACALLAIVVVVATARRDPRLRLRDDIADAVGSPVLAAMRSRPQRSVAGWSTLLENYRPSASESWALRRVLRSLAPSDRRHTPGRVDHPPSLTVISIAGDSRGLALGAQLAAFASSLGIVTHLVPTVGHVRAPHLWAACAKEDVKLNRPNLLVGQASDGTKVDLTIDLVIVERIHPYLRDTPPRAATVLCVGTSTASEQELARVAVAADDAGRQIDGVIVADPDESDRTSGRHTMSERTRQLALPTKLTGIAPPERATASEIYRGGA